MAEGTPTVNLYTSQNPFDGYTISDRTVDEQTSTWTIEAKKDVWPKKFDVVKKRPNSRLYEKLRHRSSPESGFLGTIRKYCCSRPISTIEDVLENPALEAPIADVLEEPIKMCQPSGNSKLIFPGSVSTQKVTQGGENQKNEFQSSPDATSECVYGVTGSLLPPQDVKTKIKSNHLETLGFIKTHCGSGSNKDKSAQVNPSTTNAEPKAFKTDILSENERENKSVGCVYLSKDASFNVRTNYKALVSGSYQFLGKGGNSSVVRVCHDQKAYAMKKTKFRELEIKIHAELQHQNIIPLHAVIYGEHEERKKVFELSSYHFMSILTYDLSLLQGCYRKDYNSDEFKQMLNNNPELAEHQGLKFVLSKILDALSYMHSKGYVHRDVKPSNVMLTRCSKGHYLLHCTCGSNAFDVKLGDFGSACKKPNWDHSDSDAPVSTFSYRRVGTPGYLAPEVAMNIAYSGPFENLYTTAVDLWSFASLITVIATGAKPAKSQRQIASLLLSKSLPNEQQLFDKVTKLGELKKLSILKNESKLIELTQKCLDLDFDKRPTAEQAKAFLV